MITHGFPPECSGGTESYVLALCKELQELGHDVQVLSGSHEGAGPDQPEPRLDQDEHEGVIVHRLHRTGLFVDNWEKSLAPEVEPLVQFVLRDFQPDVVHVQHWIRMTRNLVETCHDAGIPAVCTLHDLWTCCPKAFRIRDNAHCDLEVGPQTCLGCAPAGENMSDEEQRRELAQFRDDFENELDLARRLVVPSCAHRDVLLGQLPGLRGKFRVVPHGNISQIRRRPPATGSFPDGPLRIGHWGHLSSFKGVDLLLQALAHCRHRQQIELHLFGEVVYPQERDRIHGLAEGLNVTWHGRYDPLDLTKISVDLAVIPSRCSESWSFVLDEAFLLGLPVIVPNRGALGERVKGAGAAFEADDPASLTAVFDRLFLEPSMLHEWRDRIPTLPQMKKHTEAIERVYGEAVSSRAPLPRTPLEVRKRRLDAKAYQLEQRNRAMEDAMARMRNLQSDYDRANTTLEEMDRSHREKDKRIAQLQEDVESAHEATAEQGAAKIENLESRIADLENTGARLQMTEQESRALLETRQAEMESLEAAYADVLRHQSEIDRSQLIHQMSSTIDGLLATIEGGERKNRRPNQVTKRRGERLKILMVVHQFLPRHVAGTEVYTHNLAKELARRHDVLVLSAESDHDKERFHEQRIMVGDLPVHQMTHNYQWSHFRDTYDCPEADVVFRALLREERPDIVHIQHLHYFSANFVTIARSKGIPIVYTLHDYMLMCPRDGTLRREDGELCQTPVPSRCKDCIAHHSIGVQSPPILPRGLRPGLDALVPGDVVQEIRRNRNNASGSRSPHEQAVEERLDYLKHVLDDVDLFVSPSAFLRERFIESGLIDGDRIMVSDNGYETDRFDKPRAPEARQGNELRVGYVGTIAPHKGIHMLIDAMNGIDDPRVSCRIWGDLSAFWEYTVGLWSQITNPRTLLMGSFDNDRITDVLGQLDLLVVPSLWFENSPLTIHEAAACGVPVLATDQGGLAEYVTPEVTGRLFQLGNMGDLRAKILSFLETPMTSFDPSTLEIKSIEQDAKDTEQRYFRLLGRAGSLVD